ncbi:hypothetical protein [Paenibacillus tyrfis]|uniref:hypothetical protein n=1 Tax=Paenibacillus tyrfis TaxID=1501230 RepID=UPI0020A0D843|nr:hypothetical protein [Paenibacillus tyrfis]MCP1311055.1 hypothetical protein [Paenibacillus tyrfis]
MAAILIEMREDARRTDNGHTVETRKTARFPAKRLGGEAVFLLYVGQKRQEMKLIPSLE